MKVELFAADALPVLQNRMFPDRASALDCARGDMRLVQDLGSGLVYNAAFDASLLVYDEEYQNEQGVSSVFSRHLDGVTAILHKHLQGCTLIEVGCGKGTFLEHLQREGFAITGIDPAYEGRNPAIVKARFEAGLGLSADGIVLRHVLEHMVDPMGFLSAIVQANASRGLIYIEVPCFDWICANRAWFDIFYEHVNYFRLDDFHRMFGRVLDSGRVFGGQYLYVVADLASLRPPRAGTGSAVDFPTDFLNGVDAAARRAEARPATVWGGASKGVIFTLHLQRQGVTPARVIDISPAKQGKYLAASGLQVLSPEQGMASMQPGDDVFVMNSNYLDEIASLTHNRFNYLSVEHAHAP